MQSLALLADGKVVNWGWMASSRPPPSDLYATAITAGQNHYAALTPAGTVVVWGNLYYGQGNVPVGLRNVVEIAAGRDHTLALKGDGGVVAWGKDSYQCCAVPASATNVVAVAAYGDCSLAIRSDGSVVGWGNNQSKQMDPPTGFSNVVALTGNDFFNPFTLALRNLGEPASVRKPLNLTNWAGPSLSLLSNVAGRPPLAYQWHWNGENIPGATNSSLSLGSLEVRHSGLYTLAAANALGALTSQVATLTVRPQLTIAAWGLNGDGQCDVPVGLSNITALATGLNRVLALDDSGSVHGWGAAGGYQALVPNFLTNVVAIAVGDFHNVALTKAGTLVCWGNPTSSLFTNPISLYGPFVKIAAASSYFLALSSDGRVHAQVDTTGMKGPINPPWGLSDVTAIAAGSQHAMALKTNGTVVAWGWNYFGQATPPPGLSQVVSIACGAAHSLALKADGTVVAWGDNTWGQTNVPSGLTNVIEISTAGNHSLARLADQSIVAWGENTFGQSQVPAGLTNAAAIAGGGYHSLALVPDSAAFITQHPRGQSQIPGRTALFRVTPCGTAPLAYQWRWNGVDLPEATDLSLTLSNVQPVDAGSYTVVVSNRSAAVTSRCASLTLGSVAAWGLNTLEQAFVPAGLTAPTAIAAGSWHTAVLQADGTVLAWGDIWAHAPPLSQIVSVVAGNNMTLALRVDGTVVAWGDTNLMLTGFPNHLTDITSVALGDRHGLALRAQGGVVGWGSSVPWNQAIVPSDLTNAVAIAAGAFHSLALRRDGAVLCWGSVAEQPAGPEQCRGHRRWWKPQPGTARRWDCRLLGFSRLWTQLALHRTSRTSSPLPAVPDAISPCARTEPSRAGAMTVLVS